MKRIRTLSILLCAAMVMALTACAGKPEPTAVTTHPTTQATTLVTTTETTVPGYTDPSVTYHAPMSAVSLPTITETGKADDGATLLTYTYQDITLFLPEAMVADDIFMDYQNRLSVSHTYARDLHTAAVSAYAGQEDWQPYSLLVRHQPMRFDEMVLSLFATEAVYDGNARGSSTNFSVNYDLLTGNALTLPDVLKADFSATDLVDLIVAGLAEYEKQEMLFPDYAQQISDMFFTNHTVESWYFAQDGLCFFFNPYEIAPYSSGIIVSKIPYDALGDLLKDGYFPGETVAFTGTPRIDEFSAANTGNITSFSELMLSETGKEYLLCADGTLLNVRIEAGTWSEGSKEFTTEATVFAATAISAGDGVLIQCDDIGDLRLLYESQGQVHQLLLLWQ